MNAPRHHFPDDVLLEYVAGNTGEAVSLAVACHASLCAACRRQIAWLERMGGALVESAPAAALHDDALTRALARLDEPAVPAVPAPEPPKRPVPGFEFAPRPLWPYLSPQRAAFTEVVPGIGAVELGIPVAGGWARLVKLAPDVVIPDHDHAGAEYGVLFQGGLRDQGELFHRGDVFHKVPGEQHNQIVLPGEPCIALVVNEGNLIPLTPEGEVLKLFSV